MCGSAGLEKSLDNSLTRIFVESMGLPPPRLINASAPVSRASWAAFVIGLKGACCSIP